MRDAVASIASAARSIASCERSPSDFAETVASTSAMSVRRTTDASTCVPTAGVVTAARASLTRTMRAASPAPSRRPTGRCANGRSATSASAAMREGSNAPAGGSSRRRTATTAETSASASTPSAESRPRFIGESSSVPGPASASAPSAATVPRRSAFAKGASSFTANAAGDASPSDASRRSIEAPTSRAGSTGSDLGRNGRTSDVGIAVAVSEPFAP